MRIVVAAVMLALSPSAASAQALSTLHITVRLPDAAGTPVPLARHALLISEEPPTAAPRRTVTTLAGTADVSLRPGHYAVESDQPAALNGKLYEWSQRIEIVAGRDATLDLTADNAAVSAGTAPASATVSNTDTSFVASQSQDSVVLLWTPTRHASGFLVDARGLIVTSQRIVGAATSVEAQLTADTKVKATVLVSDATRDVAILWVNPSASAALRPLSLGCGGTRPSVANGHEIYAVGVGVTGRKHLESGDVTGVGPRLLLSDLSVTRASAGGPVFSAGGLIGFTTVEDRDPDSQSDARVVRIEQACEVMASIDAKMADATPPDATHLPLDPPPVAVSALAGAMKGRAGSLTPYAMSTDGFDVAFITPVHMYAATDRLVLSPMDFGRWSEFFSGYPRALLIRVTPRMVEGLWAKVARGAAMTQGVALPALKTMKSGFLRMRAFCGDAEVTPIHPFVVERRTSETESVSEGLYMFDPAAFGPACGTVRLTVYSEAEPDKADTRVVEPKVLQQIAADFAAL